MDFKKKDLMRNNMPGLPSISSAENNSLFSRNHKTSLPSCTLPHKSVLTNPKRQRAPTSVLEEQRPVKNNSGVPDIFQLHSSKLSQNWGKDVLGKSVTLQSGANDKKSTKLMSSKLRNEKISLADINESTNFTIKPKMTLKNVRGNSLWQKSVSLRRNKMASGRVENITFPERIEDSRRSQETCYKPHLQVTALEQLFSIRNTIKQFRKWYFEQNMDKMKTSTIHNSQESLHRNKLIKESFLNNEFIRMFEKKIAQEKNVEFDIPGVTSNYKNTDNCDTNVSGNFIRDKQLTRQRESENGQTYQEISAFWSNQKGSEAYNKIKGYAGGNGLVSPDRELWVQVWVDDVQTRMEETGRELDETFE